MIDETNAPVVEPTNIVHFRSRSLLRQHVIKHVCTARDEKWWQLPGFNEDLISAGKCEEEDSLTQLMIAYETLLNQKIAECCQNQKNHVHQLRIGSELPERFLVENNLDGDRHPELLIKIWTSPENLVIVLSALVQKGQILPYIIKTGYRTEPGTKKERWLKKQRNRDCMRIDLSKRKKFILLADHMNGPLDNKEGQNETLSDRK